MQIIGYILIVVVVGLFIGYFRWSTKEASTVTAKEGQVVTVIVEGNYSPNLIRAKVGQTLTITFDRREDSSCSKKVIIEGFDIHKELLDFGKTDVVITPNKKGTFSFTCEMGMYQGKIVVE